jgi:LPS-assembly lipoprotein
MRTLLIALFALTLTACGFHLRGVGVGALPFASISIKGDGAFADELRTYLHRDRNVQVLNDGKADAQIVIRGEKYSKDIQSINSVGRVAEYRLNLQLDFQVVKGDQVVLENGQQKLHRTLTWDENNVLPKESEEALLQKDMRRDAIQLILLRTIAAVRQ